MKVVHDKIEVISIIESTDHVGNEGISEMREYFHLVEDIINALLDHDKGFGHFLHGVDSSGFVVLNFPNFSVPTLPNHVQKVKITPQYFLLFFESVACDLSH